MSVISIGTFDGLHLGHQKLVSKMVELSQRHALKPIVISYRDHPAFTLEASAQPRMLCPASIKVEELKRLGIQHVELLEFTPQFAAIKAQDFLRDYLVAKWHPSIIVVGYDSHFGAGREGNRAWLEAQAGQYGYQVEFVKPVLYQGQPISSSKIRDLLQRKELETANTLLGRPYRLAGVVCKGISLGTSMGFPTANLELANPHQLVPADGIYLSRVRFADRVFFGLTNIGKSPTVKHTGNTEIETYILGFEGDIYGIEMQVELLKYIREERMFSSTDELVRQIRQDLIKAQVLIGEVS